MTKALKTEAVAARHRATEKTPKTAKKAGGERRKASEIASMLGITSRRLQQLATDGHVPPSTRDGYLLAETVNGYVRFLSGEKKDNTKAAAATRVSDARAREIELRIAREEGALVDMEDVEAVFTNTIGIFRSELTGVPAGATRDRITRAAIEKGINGALARCERRFAEAGEALRAGRDPLPGEGEDDT